MIYEVTYYTAKCDHCKVEYAEDSPYSAWSDKDNMKDILRDCDWYVDNDDEPKHKDKTYCSDCWSYDDNDYLELYAERLNKHQED